MPVKSLMELAMTACLKNHRELDSVGDFLTYEHVRPILMKVDNAHQLRQIELNSPQIEGDTGEVWLKIIEREFPMEYKTKAYKPTNPKKWHRVWEKYKKDHDRALEESEKKLMNALAGLRQDKEKNTSRIADKTLDRKLLPRTAIKKSSWGGSWGQRDPNSGTFAFTKGSRTKTNTGASVMRRVRREVKEIANIHGSLSRPVRGSAALTRPIKPPTGMVNDYRRAAQPVYRPTPRPLSSAVEEYEERATYLSDSEGGDSDRDALFDEDEEDTEDYGRYAEPAPARSPTRKTFAKSSATSLLKKRPGSTTSISPAKPRVPAASSTSKVTTKRSGILSNSYKPDAAKTTRISSSNSTTSARAPPPASELPPPKPSHHHLPRTQTSPPLAPNPGPSSPPPPLSMSGPADSQPRKRKSVNIFMSRKKRG
ncbi:RNA polymerase II transcription factor SIII subunit A-domain-containing protein [Mariannaea sp. PMI_226]|nr:RNA polymerase II transcription factor SIII subunit A-domain-containing protein [Mariannaea sp. PMI_226]